MNEVNLDHLCSKANLAATKTLGEGMGKSIENKYGHPFTGFIDAYILITCNSLKYPFVPLESSRSGFSKKDYPLDKRAMLARFSLVEFTKTF